MVLIKNISSQKTTRTSAARYLSQPASSSFQYSKQLQHEIRFQNSFPSFKSKSHLSTALLLLRARWENHLQRAVTQRRDYLASRWHVDSLISMSKRRDAAFSDMVGMHPNFDILEHCSVLLISKVRSLFVELVACWVSLQHICWERDICHHAS